MAEASLQLNSLHRNGGILLGGKFIPSKDYAEVTSYMSRWRRRVDEGAASADADVDRVVSFMKDMKVLLKKVWIRFPRHDNTNVVTAIAMKFVQAYQELATENDSLELGFIVSNNHDVAGWQWQFLDQEICKNSLIALKLEGNDDALSHQAVTVLSSLSRLRRLQADFDFAFLSTNGFLDSLAAANFPHSLDCFCIRVADGAEKASALVAFLRGKQQLKHVHLKMSTAAIPVLYDDVMRFRHLQTLKLELSPAAGPHGVTPNYYLALYPCIANSFSPHLKLFHLQFNMPFTEGFTSLLRQGVVGAMNQNKSMMRLEAFTLEFPHQPIDEDLRKLIEAGNMFAASKKTMRASSGPDRLPAALLPRAAMAIKTHPGVDPDWACASMLHSYLRSNPGVIGAALGHKKGWDGDESTGTNKRKFEE